MALRLKLECKAKNCKFFEKCIIVRPIKTLDPNDAGGEFAPIIKQRLIRLQLQIRCYSFEEKRN